LQNGGFYPRILAEMKAFYDENAGVYATLKKIAPICAKKALNMHKKVFVLDGIMDKLRRVVEASDPKGRMNEITVVAF
jgi:hypothetical protein